MSTINQSVSVIIPAYNRAGLIERAIHSVLSQSCPPSEIIVVDDASSDNTIDAALNVCPECRIIRMESNQGAQAARAAGIRAATGNWIGFLDSDDTWLPKKLEWQLEKAAQGFAVVHGPGIIRKGNEEKPFAVPALEGNIFQHLLQCPAPLYPCLLVRRFCFEKAGYPDPAIAAYQEWDMSLLLARHYSFGYVDKPLFVYEIQTDSISKDSYRGLRGYEQIVYKWWKNMNQIDEGVDGFVHYQRMASQAYRLTGIWGYIHYLRLGARLTGRTLRETLKAGIHPCLNYCRHTLATRFPFLRVMWRAFFRKKGQGNG